MQVSRQELIERLSDFSGPLDAGVFVGYEHCLDDLMARWLEKDELFASEQLKDEWIAQVDLEPALEAFLDVLVAPPPEIADREFQKGWEANLGDYLTRLCRRAPELCLERLGPLMAQRSLRAFLFHIAGQISHPAGLKWMKPYIGQPDLSENEWLTLAKSIRDIGGREAYGLLVELRHAAAYASPELQLLLVRML